MSTQVDLRQLVVTRTDRLPGPGRHLVTRYALPGLVALGFLGLIGWAARDSLLPSRPVTVAPVLVTRAEVRQEGTPLFQAAGWIEPRPTPVLVTALAEGVVEKLLVVEGQEVKAGELLATLVDADAKLALAAALADLRQREAEADSLLAKVESDLVFIPFQLQAAEANERLARIDLDNKKAAANVVPPITIYRAESELAAATAKVAELRARKQRLEREARSLEQMRAADGKRESTGPLTEAEAAMQAALTRVRQAEIAVAVARLRLERMTIHAPINGRVLALIARPGARLMGFVSGHDATTIVSLYEPTRLQVRADVRFDDLLNVQPGQRVRIESTAAPGKPIAGAVLFSTAQADIQKNTLQVKVMVQDPPAVLKPDMLVQVTFLAPPRPEAEEGPSERLRMLVPRQLVETADGGPRIWIADQVKQQARARRLQLGQTANADLIEVLEGLTPADKLIVAGREGLVDGQRITILGEDATLGTAGIQGGAKSGRLQRLQPGHQGKH